MRISACATVLLLACFSVAAPAAPGPTMVRVLPGWRDAAAFKRIAEYFDGRENTGGEPVLRTHPDQRGGFYFLVRLDNPGPPLPVRFQLLVVTPHADTPRTFTFPGTLPAGETVFHLGLTGPDWPDPKAHPVAWKLLLTDETGRTVVTEASYLWEKSAGP